MSVPSASITFFSGTGNTRHACGLLAAGLEREGWRVRLQEIEPPRPKGAAAPVRAATAGPVTARPTAVRQAPAASSAAPDLAVFAFPVFAFGVPHIVRRFLRRLPPVGGTPAAVVAVFGDDFTGPPSARRRASGSEGGALAEASRLLSRKGYAVRAVRGVGFPHSFTQLSSPPDEEECRVILAGSEAAVAAIAADLAAGHREPASPGPTATGWRWVIRAGFSLVGRRALGKMYVADERCTSCGWCERACPSRTIRMRGTGRMRRLPRWGWRCEACQRCINGCPEAAIQVSALRIAVLTVAALPWGLLVARSVPWLSFPGGGALAWLAGVALLTAAADQLLRLLERVPGLRRLARMGHTRAFRRYRGPRGTDA